MWKDCRLDSIASLSAVLPRGSRASSADQRGPLHFSSTPAISAPITAHEACACAGRHALARRSRGAQDSSDKGPASCRPRRAAHQDGFVRFTQERHRAESHAIGHGAALVRGSDVHGDRVRGAAVADSVQADAVIGATGDGFQGCRFAAQDRNAAADRRARTCANSDAFARHDTIDA